MPDSVKMMENGHSGGKEASDRRAGRDAIGHALTGQRLEFR